MQQLIIEPRLISRRRSHLEKAVGNADSINDVRLRIKLESKDSKDRELGDTLRNVTYK